MQSDDALTTKEISQCVQGSPAYRPTQWDYAVAQAQRRKSLWWAVHLLEEFTAHASTMGSAGAGFQANLLKQNLERLGIEPWPHD